MLDPASDDYSTIHPAIDTFRDRPGKKLVIGILLRSLLRAKRRWRPLLTPCFLPSVERSRPCGFARVCPQRARLLVRSAAPHGPGGRAHLRGGRLRRLRVGRNALGAAARPKEGTRRTWFVERRHRRAERWICQPRQAAIAPAIAVAEYVEPVGESAVEQAVAAAFAPPAAPAVSPAVI